MKKIITLLIYATTVALLAACGGSGSSIDSALSQMEKAMEKVEKNKTSMTEADWRALNEELEEPSRILTEALENNDVGAMKKLKISAVVLRYAAVAGEAAFHTATDSLKNMMGDFPLQETLETDEMQQAIQELEKALENDDVQEVLKKLGE